MKIIATIIHNGISYGIPEGTKVPEKPTVCVIPCFAFGQQCTCDKLKNNYYNGLQALLSVSIQWEDQEAIEHILCLQEPRDICGGIYPLEGVEAENKWQYRVKGYVTWTDCTKDRKPVHANPRFDYREVLRIVVRKEIEDPMAAAWRQNKFKPACDNDGLIPQPNSEQKKNEFDKATIDHVFGVDEKKEPETPLVAKPPLGLIPEKLWHKKEVPSEWANEYDRRMKELGGVSEEEPTPVIDFAVWYSGMERSKVLRAYERYKKETFKN